MMPDCNGKMFKAYVQDVPGIGCVAVDKVIADLSRNPARCLKLAVADAKREARQ